MINIKIGKDLAGNIILFTVKGHAGFAEKGTDIVCSAVSAVAYTAVGALKELIGLKNFFKQHKLGIMHCRLDMDLTPEIRHDTNIIMAAAEIGFKQIENAYPDYVKVMDEEV